MDALSSVKCCKRGSELGMNCNNIIYLCKFVRISIFPKNKLHHSELLRSLNIKRSNVFHRIGAGAKR